MLPILPPRDAIPIAWALWIEMSRPVRTETMEKSCIQVCSPQGCWKDLWCVEEDNGISACDAKFANHVAGNKEREEVSAIRSLSWDEHSDG